METIKINQTPIFIHNEDFQSILVYVLFPFEEKEEELAESVLLPSLFCNTSEQYPTEEDFQKEKKRLTILGMNCSRSVIGNTGCYSFHFIIPDTYTIQEDLLEKQFSFFEQVLYHPLLEDGGFEEKQVDREIRNIHTAMDNALQNIRSYQSIRIRELIDDEGILSRDLIHCREKLDTMNGKDLYQYYQKIILNQQPTIYIMGNVEEEKVRLLCQKYILRKPFKELSVSLDLYHFLKPRDKVLELEENSSFKDSSYTFVYKIPNMKKEDVVYLSLLKDLLSSLSSRLLSKKLRYENDLIYSSKVLPYPHFGAFEITVFIQKSHLKKAKKALQELIQDLKKEEVIEPLLDNIKKRNHINLLRQLDDKYFLLEDYIMKDLGIDDSLEEFYQKVDAVTAQDIHLFVDRLVLDTVFFLKEEEHE